MALAVLPISKPGGYIVQFHALYSKIPFDGEKQPAKNLLVIDAVEQTIFFATGRAAENADSAERPTQRTRTSAKRRQAASAR